MISVLDGGVSTTVQDAGRFGLYHIGMPPSGALDDFSFRAANLLVGNDETAPVLEATYNGPRLAFEQDTLVAVTGADLPAKVDGEERPAWEAFTVRAGQELTFDYLRAGARPYIAVAGGFKVPEVMGSSSTYTLVALGGCEGRALRAGDSLRTGEPRGGREGARVAERLRPQLMSDWEIRVVTGLCDYRLSEAGHRTFLETEWTVTPAADRIGYRYQGAELEFVEREPPFGAGSDPSNVVDVGYPIGSIQVPGGVEPIALLNDAVTGGGYATIATIISADRDAVAQSKTHDRTRFVAVPIEDALAARAERRRRLDEVRDSLT
ncbi:5-oxoprolinase subunit C family protein [Capillimicrobium parvum]|uniref:5-oxoprolinase subunit C n=1 Tax=Capillimicrobium parvum TaxID=2884022 RepID=A0A9E6XY59_9ACTN|nr:biotin-dependent carboxyltransferase family protein [Capillimicrobium parvum]UGS35961.1 5-oxoprolinase subunit C [Capillimicrobium parvum]